MIHRGMLSDYFSGIAVKKLSAVETSPSKSNQHEFNSTAVLKSILGNSDRKNIPTRFIWLSSEQEGITDVSSISWYDARLKHPSRSEFRLYYPSNEVTNLMQMGDTFFLAMKKDGTATIIITPSGSTIENQMVWLFGLEGPLLEGFVTNVIGVQKDAELDFAARFILDEIGVDLEDAEAASLDPLIEKFGVKFPSTREFSKLAQDSLSDISGAYDDPDVVIMAWLDREEMLFRRLERRIVSERLTSGFIDEGNADVDGFIKYSLSVQNRRKSRAGQSLENHIERLLLDRKIPHSRGALTENGHKPDFLFPSVTSYHDSKFPSKKLKMLGAKSSLKDRWRQVLTEAERIDIKHLLTLEPAISEKQTNQMKQANLQLVVPKRIQASYKAAQQDWLLSVQDFLSSMKS